jgi:hypothetical protein
MTLFNVFWWKGTYSNGSKYTYGTKKDQARYLRQDFFLLLWSAVRIPARMYGTYKEEPDLRNCSVNKLYKKEKSKRDL